MKGKNKKRSPKEFSTKDYFNAYALDFRNNHSNAESPDNRGRNALKPNMKSQIPNSNGNAQLSFSNAAMTFQPSQRLDSTLKKKQMPGLNEVLVKVDEIFTQAMENQKNKIDFLKVDLKTSPRDFNNQEVNITRLYKQRQEREIKLNLKLKLSNNSEGIDPRTLSPQKIEQLLKEQVEDEVPKVISMRQYLDGFCKDHNIDIDKTDMLKLPMHLYLGSAENGAFSKYKKGGAFDQISKNQKFSKLKQEEEQEKLIRDRLMLRHGFSQNRNENDQQFKTKWHQKAYERRNSLKKSKSPRNQLLSPERSVSVEKNFYNLSKTTITTPRVYTQIQQSETQATSQEYQINNNLLNNITTINDSITNTLDMSSYQGIQKYSEQSIDEKELQNSLKIKNQKIYKKINMTLVDSKESLRTDSPKQKRQKAISMLGKSPKDEGAQRMSLPQLENRRNGNFTKRTEFVNHSQDIVLPRVNKSVNNQPSTKNLRQRATRIQFIRNKAAEETNLYSHRSEQYSGDHPNSQSLHHRQDNTHSQHEKKKLLDQIIKSCYKEAQKSDQDMRDLDYELLVHNLKQSQFQQVVETLKELEYATPQTIPVLYKYKEKVKEEMDDEENEVSKEYRSGRMDPSREVAQFEKGRSIKKKVGKKRDIEERFKLIKEQKSIITGINYLSLV
ncbi:UNKNOWN [Stylonychia lemnae]|uniref:Uncharacterized protein n=1 Tax=Stylonychia lemnae TaxID=5949 RepID=A0A078AEC1_STYLE|nr:UNKNOWN [Stylonychia lemnae]|eukprot:CDW80609.1 UNKNOWN [Stylonychia lemnae]